MCHHYIARNARKANLKPEWLNEFSVRSNLYQLILPEIGFYPLDQVPVVRLDAAGEREAAVAEWGLLPGWWKPSDMAPKRTAFQRKTINARSEDVDAKPTYRDAFRRRRCLMPAEEMFVRGRYFHLADFRPFAFAALWDRWRDADGAVLETCTMLTTEPNEAVRAVGHERIPVILTREEEYARWLDPEIAARPLLEELMRPTPARIWQSYRAEHAAKSTVKPTARSGGGTTSQADNDSGQGFLF